MKSTILILQIVLFFISISFSQEWKNYPYHEDETVIYFPEDEGWHQGENIEWWYTTAHLHGEETGNDYTIMLTYFYYDTLGFDGFRILNIANETTGEFEDEMQVCTYTTLSEDHLEIQASLFPNPSVESWVTLTEENVLLPFQYHLSASSTSGSIDLDYNTVKRPLILGDDGFFYQGSVNYTYYYSLTGIEASGNLSFNGVTESVTGTAWIDRQYGSFNPLTGENYEWFSMQLSNGMDINLWNIFTVDNEIPDTVTYKVFSAYVNEDSSYTSSDFELKRLGFSFTPDNQRCYATKWQLLSEINGMNLIITVNNNEQEVTQPFHFFEGSTTISGTINGVDVTGVGFAELLHRYKNPILQITSPSEGWNVEQPIKWTLLNPDEGCPLKYDIDISYDDQTTYHNIVQGLVSEEFLWDAAGFPDDGLYWFRITGYSIDSTIVGTTETSMAFPLTTSIFENDINTFVKIYPNPAYENIFIDLEQNNMDIVDVKIINEAGQIVKAKTVNGNLFPIDFDLKNIEQGNYFIEVSSKGIQSITQFAILK